MFFDKDHVKIHGCTLVWDGITQPDISEKDGSKKYNVKVLIPPHCQDINDFDQLQNTALQSSKFKGVLPAGGRMAMGQTQPGEFDNRFPGHKVISAKTNFMPDVYDENGAPLDPMQLNALMYQGQQIDILIHCYDYDAMGNKGIGAGLDGFAIIASANAPRQQLSGTGGINTAGAFGGGGQQQAAPQQGFQQQAAPQQGFQQQAAPQQGFQQQAAPQQGFQQQAAPQQAAPQQAAPQQGFQQQAAPQQGFQQQAAPQQGGIPNQSQNFMPGQ